MRATEMSEAGLNAFTAGPAVHAAAMHMQSAGLSSAALHRATTNLQAHR